MAQRSLWYVDHFFTRHLVPLPFCTMFPPLHPYPESSHPDSDLELYLSHIRVLLQVHARCVMHAVSHTPNWFEIKPRCVFNTGANLTPRQSPRLHLTRLLVFIVITEQKKRRTRYSPTAAVLERSGRPQLQQSLCKYAGKRLRYISYGPEDRRPHRS